MIHGLTGNEPLALFLCNLVGSLQYTEIAFHIPTEISSASRWDFSEEEKMQHSVIIGALVRWGHGEHTVESHQG